MKVQTAEDLKKMSEKTDWKREELVNIEEIEIDPSLPEAARMQTFLEQIKNPYHFRCGDTIVHLKFPETGEPLKGKLIKYLMHLKNT